VEVSLKSRLIKILPRLVERPQAFNKTMEKAEWLWGAKEDILWGYSGRNFNANLPSHRMREG
jgi:hypothetical protein